MKNRSFLVLFVSIGLVLVLAALPFMAACAKPAPSPTPKTIKWLYSFGIPRKSLWSWDHAGEKYCQLVNERSGGRLQIVLMSCPELGYQGSENLRIVRDGLADMVCIDSGYVAGDMPYWGTLDLPMFIPSWEKVRGTTEAVREIRQKELLDKFNCIEVLFSSYTSFVYFFDKNPPKKVADFQGRKTRVTGIVPSLLVKTLGATPVVIAGPELYTSVQQGIVDSVITMPGFALGLSLQEVLHYYIQAPLWAPNFAVLVNKDSFDKLPSDLQKIVLDTGKELSEEAWVLSLQKKDEDLQKWQAAGGTEAFLDPGEVKKIEALGPAIWKKWYDEIADETAKQAFDVANKYLGR